VLNTIEKSHNETFLISDSGFFEEAKPLIDYFGERNCLLIRLSRPGYDFSNDSRSYWSHNYKYLEEISIINNSSTVDLLYECMNKIDIWMEYK
jgi:hypothetical protein